MDKERENFYRIITLILNLGTKAKRELLKYHLKTENISIQYLLGMYEHDLYHLYFNNQKCCKCTPNYRLPKKRILNLTQLDILFDKYSARPPGSVSTNCNTSGFCCCQLSAKTSLSVDQLDFTLTRCLLINCCEKLFCSSMLSGNTLESVLNAKKHELYHLWQPQSSCCLCPSSCQQTGQCQVINNKHWSKMYNVTNLHHKCSSCGSLGDACSIGAVPGISLNILDTKLIPTILNTCCTLKQTVEELAELRNVMYGHALETSITDQDFNRNWLKVETCVLELAKFCGTEIETKFKDKINQIKMEPLDGTLYQQYHTEILKEIKDNSDIKEEIVHHFQQTKEIITSSQNVLDSTLSDLNVKLDKLLETTERNIAQKITQSIQTETTNDDSDNHLKEFNKKLNEKEADILKLQKDITEAEHYKMTFEEKSEELKQTVKQRSKTLQDEIIAKEEMLLQEVERAKNEAFQKFNGYVKTTSDFKQKCEKKLNNYKKMLTNLQDDEEMVEQFVQDSMPTLDSMKISVEKRFPRPLTFECKPSSKVAEWYGELTEDKWFSQDGVEKPKYRNKLDVLNQFKVEYTKPGDWQASVYQIIIRPNHKAWVSTTNYNLFLVDKEGNILIRRKMKCLVSRSACDRKDNLYLCDNFNDASKIMVINLKQLEQDKNEDPVIEFENMLPFSVCDLNINKEDILLVLLAHEDAIKIAVFSEARMFTREINFDEVHSKNIDKFSYLTQTSSGQIFISGKTKLVVVEPCGTKMKNHQFSDDEWGGKSIIADPFENVITTECPFKKRPLNIYVTDAKMNIVKTFTVAGPSIYGLVNLAIDYSSSEPLLWMSSSSGHVIIAKFVNIED